MFIDLRDSFSRVFFCAHFAGEKFKSPWKNHGLFSHLHHRQQTIPADEIDLFRGPHALSATGADQLAGAAGSGRWRRGDSSRCSCADAPRREAVVAAHMNIFPPLLDDKRNQSV